MKKVRLGDIADIVTGSTPSMKESSFYDGNDICFFKPSDISDEISYLSNAEYFVSNGARSKCRMLPVDSILVTCIGSIGKVAIIGIEATCNQQINAVLPNKDKFYSKFLAYSIFSQQRLLQRIANAPVVPIINKKDFSNIIIPYTNLHEQSCIIERLDKVCESIRLKKQQLFELNNLVKSQFIEMFGDEKNPYKWDIVNVEDVADVQVGVVIKPAQYYTTKEYGIKTFRSLNIGPMHVKDSDWVYFSEEGNEKNAKSILKENDLLIVRSGAPGTACVVTSEYAGCNAVDIIIAHPNTEKVNPYFLCQYTNLPHGKKQIEEGTGGAAQQHFNVGKFNKLKLMLPPMDKQNEFEQFVKQVDKSKIVGQMTTCFDGEKEVAA